MDAAQNFLITSISRHVTPSGAVVATAGRGDSWSIMGNFDLLRRLENMGRDATGSDLSRKLDV